MTPSRRHLFALLGLVLPVAAFTASPARGGHVEPGAPQIPTAITRRPRTSRSRTFLGAQHIAPHDTPYAETYRELTFASLRAFASSSARSPTRIRSGVGGQPLISRSTGKVVPAPPVTA